MLTHNALVEQLRPLIHPMLVHFPIALLFASVALDWIGYWLKHPNLTRAGFYTLVLGAFAAGIAALSGPDHASGDSSVPALLAAHQTWASVTVALAVVMVAARFIAASGLNGGGALLYLASTLALIGAVSLTGYYGGELTYHHAVGVIVNGAPVATTSGVAAYVSPLIPAKPFVALVGLLVVIGFCVWMALGRRLFPMYFPAWWRAVRQEHTNTGGRLWTLRRGSDDRAAVWVGTPTQHTHPAPQGWVPPIQRGQPGQLGQPGQPGQQAYPWTNRTPAASASSDDQRRGPFSRH